MRRILLAVALLFAACSDGNKPEPVWGFCGENTESLPVRPEPEMEPTLPFLHVEGTDVVDPEGERVMLRGVNFGSWLMMETWIAGLGPYSEGELLDLLEDKARELGVFDLFDRARDHNAFEWITEELSHWTCVGQWRDYMHQHTDASQQDEVEALWAWFDEQPWIFEERSLWNWLWGRFGYQRMERLRAAFQDAYITELDVERLAALGLNLIRVPVWFEALETDFEGDARFRPAGWRRLDRIAAWARLHGVYLMIDLHGAPGGQSTSWHQGLEDGGVLWREPACIDKTARLWRAIASYFADDPHVAVYDLLNEPMSVSSAEEYRAVHDRLYRAVRQVDPRHIVMLEDGYLRDDWLASPAEMGWDNAMYSIHLYPGGTSAEDYLARIEEALSGVAAYYDRFEVPLFLGEFNAADGTESRSWAAAAMDLVLARLNQRGVHWAPWTWKYWKPGSLWGLYHPGTDPGSPIDTKNASFQELEAAFESLHSENFVPDPAYQQALRDNAAAAAAPLDLD